MSRKKNKVAYAVEVNQRLLFSSRELALSFIKSKDERFGYFIEMIVVPDDTYINDDLVNEVKNEKHA